MQAVYYDAPRALSDAADYAVPCNGLCR